MDENNSKPFDATTRLFDYFFAQIQEASEASRLACAKARQEFEDQDDAADTARAYQEGGSHDWT